jgi:cytidine deaminase
MLRAFALASDHAGGGGPVRPDMTGRSVPYDEADLLRRARALRSRAYAPYSHFHVGALVVTERGTYEGVNVENASYRMTTCAEQTAIARMVAEGDRGPIVAVAVVGDGADPCTPCGACRQTILEFGPHATVYASGDGGQPLIASIADLLPHGFGPHRLAQGQR